MFAFGKLFGRRSTDDPIDPTNSSQASSDDPPSPDNYDANYLLPSSFSANDISSYSNNQTSITLAAPSPSPPPRSASPQPLSTSSTSLQLTSHSSSSANPPAYQLTGDPEIDNYRAEIDNLIAEATHFRNFVKKFATAFVTLGDTATELAECTFDLCEAHNQSIKQSNTQPHQVNQWPPGVKSLIKAHRGWVEESMYLFNQQFVNPLQNNSSGVSVELDLLRPLIDWQESADRFIRELARTNNVRIAMRDAKDQVDRLFVRKCDRPNEWTANLEGLLQTAKIDMQVSSEHLLARMDSLKAHYQSVVVGRLTAFDQICTRICQHESLLMQPAVTVFQSSGLVRFEPNSPASTQSNDDDDDASSNPSGTDGQVDTLSELQQHAQATTKAKRAALLNPRRGNQVSLAPPGSALPSMLHAAEDDSVDDFAPTSRQSRHMSLANNDDGDSQMEALLATLDVMKKEIAEKEALKAQLDSLQQSINQSTNQQNEQSAAQIGSLQKQLDEKQREIEAHQIKIKEEQEGAKDGPPVIGADAPPPPPMDDVPFAPPMDDIPPPPPMDGIPPPPPMDGIPPPPGAPPMAPGFGPPKKLTARDKEKMEAKRHNLPLLPEPIKLEDCSVKRVHWTALKAEEVKGTVWENLLSQVSNPPNHLPTKSPRTPRKPLALISPAKVDRRLSVHERRAMPAIVFDIPEPSSPTSPPITVISETPTRWQWPLGTEFARTFAQKTAKTAKRKGKKRSGLTTTENSDASDDDNETRAARAEAVAKLTAKLKQTIELIDAKRSYNVSIALSHIKLDPIIIRNAIISLDDSILSNEMCEILMDCLPTSEEITVLRNFDGDREMLGDVEKFMLSMIVDPSSSQSTPITSPAHKGPTSPANSFGLSINQSIIHTRLKVLILMKSFSMVTSQLADALEQLSVCTSNILNSTAFQSVLGLILEMGNILNGANGVQQTYGFAINQSINQLKSIKSTDNQSNLLLYLTDFIQRSCPELRVFMKDLSGCRACARVEHAWLQAEIKALHQAVNVVKSVIDQDDKLHPNTQGNSDAPMMSPLSAAASQSWAGQTNNQPVNSSIPRLPEKVRAFYSFASSRVHQLEQALINQSNSFQQLVKFYAIADCSTPELVYALLADVVEAFKQADAQLIVQRESEERRKRMAEASEAMKAKSKANTRVNTPNRQSINEPITVPVSIRSPNNRISSPKNTQTIPPISEHPDAQPLAPVSETARVQHPIEQPNVTLPSEPVVLSEPIAADTNDAAIASSASATVESSSVLPSQSAESVPVVTDAPQTEDIHNVQVLTDVEHAPEAPVQESLLQSVIHETDDPSASSHALAITPPDSADHSYNQSVNEPLPLSPVRETLMNWTSHSSDVDVNSSVMNVNPLISEFDTSSAPSIIEPADSPIASSAFVLDPAIDESFDDTVD